MPGDSVFWQSQGRHRPPHQYVGGMTHMVTAATLNHAPFFRLPHRKARWLELLGQLFAEAEIQVIAWVLLDDHYHLVVVPQDARRLAGALARLHSITATEMNREEGAAGRQVWHSHWDRRLYTEGDVYSRINYVHRNPVKHGYVDDPAAWEWSSFGAFLEVEDPEVLARLKRFAAPLRVPDD